MSEHAKLSASGSKKWLNCPLSVTLEGYFEEDESIYAKEGTVAHSLGELKILKELDRITRSEYIKQKELLLIDFDTKEIEELEKYTDDYKDYVIERYNKSLSRCSESEILIEQKLDYSKYAREGYGTGDIVICDFETIEIIDLKYGKGVKIDAFENSQLMLYGLGALEVYSDLFDIKTVKMTVYQPRIDNIQTYEMSTDKLVDWGKYVVFEKAEKAYYGEGDCNYGSHCNDGFCKARPLCKAYTEHHLQVEQFEKKHPNLMTDDELINAYEIATTFDKWVSSIKTYLLQEMLKGSKFTGLKLVEGRSQRSFKDEGEVIKVLESQGLDKKDFITEKLISVANAEKLLGKSTFNEILGKFVDKPQGTPTITKAEDKRPEFKTALSDFENFGE